MFKLFAQSEQVIEIKWELSQYKSRTNPLPNGFFFSLWICTQDMVPKVKQDKVMAFLPLT